MKKMKLGGIALMWVGAIVLLNSFVGVTGLTIASASFSEANNVLSPFYLIGLGMIMIGWALNKF